MNVYLILAAYFVCINLVGFFSMYLDKMKAKKHLWRIPEATLFLIAIIGGSAGSLLGMRLFHHKTRHRSFVYGIPIILILQIILIIVICTLPVEYRIY